MAGQSGTRWSIVLSEGLDAIAFLGALSGAELYVAEYPLEAAEFATRLNTKAQRDLKQLHSSAESHEIGLLWPWLTLVFSGKPTDSLDDVIGLTDRLEDELLAPFQASVHWDERSWQWLVSNAGILAGIWRAMRDADFAQFRRDLISTHLDDRAAQLHDQLAGFDVITLQCRLSGKQLDPDIEIVLLYFCRPHGVRILGQRFIQSADFDLMTTVRIAAHELLHPPLDMHGPVAAAALEALAADDLLVRVVSEHDPAFGYTTLDGYLNEDICQALDQLIVEQLSVARNPADRWHRADDGMHVLAAGIYGFLRDDRWVERGGSIEEWLSGAASSGRLSPQMLHARAARVLERPVDRLWPLAPDPDEEPAST